MAEHVEVVIKIPKHYLTHPQDYTCLAECVRKGTILPKGHGDLVDRSCICKAIYASEDNLTGSEMTYDEMDIYNDGIDSMWDKFQNANPVIKADKGSDSE